VAKISQKKQIRDAVKELLENEDKMKITLELKDPNKFYDKNIIRLLWNKLILNLQLKIVPCHFKNWLMRTTGMKVGFDACIPHDITFDTYFPELIIIGKGALIGGESFLITHKVEKNEEGKFNLTIGKNVLAKRVMMAGLAKMHPGSKMSEHSMLNMNSSLQGIIPPKELWSGKPAKLTAELDDATIEKYFAPSKNDPNYYKDFRKKLKAFWKDPEATYLKVHYDGNRLTAGDDWFKSKSIFAIYWSGVLVELERLVPGKGNFASWLRKLLFRMAGAKIGKNVHIGKGCVLDHLMTNSITLEDDVRLDEHVYIDGHEYTTTQTIFGKTKIGKGAHLKHHSFVRTSTQIGAGSIIEPHSMAQRVIPENEVWGGIPAKFIKKLGEE
jgi:acetyltransferase-like isoleucine patch superfamily enzyme